MLPNDYTLVNPSDFTIKIALGKKPGSAFIAPFIAVSGGVRAFFPPCPDSLNPNKLNQTDVYDAGGSQFVGPDYWMEMTETFCTWALGIMLNAMRVQTNIAVCDGVIAPLGAQTDQSWAAATCARPVAMENLSTWQLFARLPNDLNDFTDDCLAGIDQNSPGSSLRCHFGASHTGAGFDAVSHSAGAARILIAINALARLARCCPVGTAGLDALSVSFLPSLSADGHVTHWAALLAAIKGEAASGAEYVAVQALFIRIVSAIVDRFSFPSTARSVPFKLSLDLAQDGSGLNDAELAVENTGSDYAESEWIPGSVEESYDNSYLSRFKSSGVFMSSAFTPMTTEMDRYYLSMSLWPIPLDSRLSIDDVPFHKWYHPDGGTRWGWATLIERIERSPIIPILPITVDYDYLRFQASADIQPLATQIAETAQETRAVITEATSQITRDLLQEIGGTEEGLSKLIGDLSARQETGLGILGAVGLVTMRKLMSPKRFAQMIEHLSSLEYQPVRPLRYDEDVTAGEPGPLGPFFDAFDKFGRIRSTLIKGVKHDHK